MTKQVQRRRGTATQHTSFTGAEGELSVNTTNKSVHVHDNVTAGGFEAARADMDNVTSSSILTAAGITATTAELNYVDGVTSNIQTQLDGKAGTASPTFTGTLTTANLTATGTTTLAGASTSADITFGDNDKAIFGAGSDLQIYSDGTHSRIYESGSGLLIVRASNFNVNNADGSDSYITMQDGGAVTAYYDGSEKIATTSTGVDITGTLTSDGLTVNGNATIQQDDALIFIKETDGTNIAAVGDLTGAGQGGAFYYDHGGTATIQLKSYEASTIENGLNVKGDISFYEDTGTTPKFFWDASAESLGIGTSSPSELLHVQGDGADILITDAAGGQTAKIGSTGSNNGLIELNNSSHTSTVFLNTAGDSYLNGGNVGIGVTNPSNKFQVSDPSGGPIASFTNTTTADLAINLTAGVSLITPSTGILALGTSGTERMRIDSSGRLLHGKTTAGDYVTGTEIQPAGAILSYRSGGVAAIHGRTNDGEIIRLTSNSSIVGVIGTNAGNIYLGDGARSLIVDGGVVKAGYSEGSDADNAQDLGESGTRWKDLYLSGGVYLGGTGSANKLEDYEEGTYTPQFVSGTYSYGNRTGNYTKVGNLVSVNVMIQWSASSSGGNFLAIELPFTVGGASALARYCGSIGYMSGVDTTTSYKQIAVTASGSATAVNFYQINDNSAPTSLTDSSLSSSGEFQMSITYQTT